jgi:hypothetical protein
MFEAAHVDDVLVVCHAQGTMPSDVWKRFMSVVRKKPITRYIGACVGAPDSTSTQRQELFAYLKENHVQVVVITDEQLVRGIVTAANWVGVNARAFPWMDMRGALEQAGITDPEEFAHMVNTISILRRSLEKSSHARRAV